MAIEGNTLSPEARKKIVDECVDNAVRDDSGVNEYTKKLAYEAGDTIHTFAHRYLQLIEASTQPATGIETKEQLVTAIKAIGMDVEASICNMTRLYGRKISNRVFGVLMSRKRTEIIEHVLRMGNVSYFPKIKYPSMLPRIPNDEHFNSPLKRVFADEIVVVSVFVLGSRDESSVLCCVQLCEAHHT